MGPKHSRDEILAAALAVARANGLSRLSFGRVATEAGTSDRMVVYYFPTKDDLVTAVLLAIGIELQERLARAFREPAADHRALARTAWPLLARPEVDPSFALFFEANGLAAAGVAPYTTLVPQLVDVWVSWVAGFLTGPTRARRAEAEATVALLDGLLLLRQLGGSAAANRAATALGLR